MLPSDEKTSGVPMDETAVHAPGHIGLCRRLSMSDALECQELEEPRKPPVRNARATDVAVSCVKNLGDERTSPDGDGCLNSCVHDSSCDGDRPLRRMGDVYPIMHGTIYSDEECDEEVSLGMLDCGARFIRYIHGLFVYLVRNAKTMGLILTTIILLLFLKYSQSLVVKTVDAILHAYPVIEPSDTLTGMALTFSTSMRNYPHLAEVLRDSGADILPSLAEGSGTNVEWAASLLSSLQAAYPATIHTNLFYAFPRRTERSSQHWGRFSCQKNRSTSGAPSNAFVCMRSLPSGTMIGFPANDTNSVLFSSDEPFAEISYPILEVLQQTASAAGALFTEGVWTKPFPIKNVYYNDTQRTVSFLLPSVFDPNDGHCIGAVGMDVDVAQVLPFTKGTALYNMEVVMVDSASMSDQGGQFLLDSLDTDIFWDTPHAVTSTPLKRINQVAEPILLRNGGSPLVNSSFYMDGLVYQSLSIMDRWALFARSPLVLSAAEVDVAISTRLKAYEAMTLAATHLFTGECETAANAASDCRFLEYMSALRASPDGWVVSLYVANILKVGEGVNEVWGSCGCTACTTNRSCPVSCFYTNSSQIEFLFDSPKRTQASSVTEYPFRRSPRYSFITTEVAESTIESGNGTWTVPYTMGKQSGSPNSTVISRILPFRASEVDGKTTAAVILDLDVAGIGAFLSTLAHEGTTALVLIDRRGEGTFIGIHTGSVTGVHPAMATPDRAINDILQAVYTEADNSFAQALSFSFRSQLINYHLVGEFWGVVEVIPGETALQRYLPAPVVSSETDALRLIPTSETMELFLYVGAILTAYFLNLLILGCSRLGEVDSVEKNEDIALCAV